VTKLANSWNQRKTSQILLLRLREEADGSREDSKVAKNPSKPEKMQTLLCKVQRHAKIAEAN
jgi:hypothetical protein